MTHTALALAALLTANLRAPVRDDGAFTGHPSLEDGAADVVLLHERFEAALPMLIEGAAAPSHGDVALAYTVDNTAAAERALALTFLTLGAEHVEVTLDGAPLSAGARAAALDEEAREAVDRLVWHRCGWRRNEARRGGTIAASSSRAAGAADRGVPDRCDRRCTPEETVAATRAVYERARRDAAALTAVAFVAPLPPGRHVIGVRYRQRLQVREGAYGTFTRGFGLRGATMGFEYLLYPAETWPRADDFRFDVSIVVPDVKRDALFGADWRAPHIATNLPLSLARRGRATTATASLPGFPADVLAVIVTPE